MNTQGSSTMVKQTQLAVTLGLAMSAGGLMLAARFMGFELGFNTAMVSALAVTTVALLMPDAEQGNAGCGTALAGMLLVAVCVGVLKQMLDASWLSAFTLMLAWLAIMHAARLIMALVFTLLGVRVDEGQPAAMHAGQQPDQRADPHLADQDEDDKHRWGW